MSNHPAAMLSPSKDTIAILALSAAALFWSGNFIAGRALRDVLDPVALNWIRWVLCLAIFLPLVGARLLRHRRIVLREWKLLLGLGATGIAAFHTLVYQALSETTAVNALLMLALAPALIMAGATLAGDSRPTPTQWSGCLVSLFGAAILVTRLDPGALRALRINPGDLWMLGAVVVWAAYSLLLRRRPPDLPPDVALAGSMIAALALLTPVLAISAPSLPPVLGPIEIGAILYIAIFASLIAFLLYSHGVARIGAARAGQFVNLMPVFGPVLAVLILGETIALSQITGAACVFAGIVLVNRTDRSPATGKRMSILR